MRGGVSGAHVNGVVSTLPQDLTHTAASVLVLQAPQGGGRTRFAIVADENNWYAISVVDTKLFFEKSIAGTVTSKSIP